MKQFFALLVSPPEPSTLIGRLEEIGGKALVAFSCADACRILERDVPVDLVFTGVNLPGGNWQGVLKAAVHNRPGGHLVVCLPQIDGGWTDLLEWGASAVLVQPYSCGRLERIVGALITWKDRTMALRGNPAAKTVTPAARPLTHACGVREGAREIVSAGSAIPLGRARLEAGDTARLGVNGDRRTIARRA